MHPPPWLAPRQVQTEMHVKINCHVSKCEFHRVCMWTVSQSVSVSSADVCWSLFFSASSCCRYADFSSRSFVEIRTRISASLTLGYLVFVPAVGKWRKKRKLRRSRIIQVSRVTHYWIRCIQLKSELPNHIRSTCYQRQLAAHLHDPGYSGICSLKESTLFNATYYTPGYEIIWGSEGLF